MQIQKTQKKFTKMAKIINYILYFYIFLLLIILFGGFVVFYNIIDADFLLFFSDYVNVIMLIIVLFGIFSYFGLIFFFLISLKNFLISLSSGDVFTENNKKQVKNLFKIFAILLSVLFLIFSGGIFLLFALAFLWVLYEVFFIGFDYKIKNDKLKEETDLTI